MAIRPVFVAESSGPFCEREYTEFEFFSGFSDKQKKRCIQSLHQAFLQEYPGNNVLEISSSSEDDLGVRLSAFYLTIPMKSGQKVTVECAFQAGKIFEHGGPYLDLLETASRTAKKDARLRNSGNIIRFTFDGEDFPSEPHTLFYNWLYLNALQAHPELAEPLMQYDAFTDIAFNPEKSLNCQAEAAAIYVSLRRRGLLEDALKSQEDFLKIVYLSSLRPLTRTAKAAENSKEETEMPTVYHSKFQVGDEIIHPKFGKGTILSIAERKNSAVLTVQFSEKKEMDEQWILKNCR